MESTSGATFLSQDDDWELCNDGGFVYKRKKRRVDPYISIDSLPPAGQIGDPKSEENQRRERKRKTLLKLKAQYQREIDQWDLLSNTLREMEERSQKIQENQRLEQDTVERAVFSESLSLPEVQRKDLTCGSAVDELLSQAEAQEAIICNVSDLCDIAEALCNEQERNLEQSLIDLPIWVSPGELMASLCDD